MFPLNSIKEVFDNRVEIARPNEKISIADLAQNVRFDKYDAKIYDTSTAVIAYDALVEQYENFEMEDGDCDYYDGAWMKFKDGSVLQFRSK